MRKRLLFTLGVLEIGIFFVVRMGPNVKAANNSPQFEVPSETIIATDNIDGNTPGRTFGRASVSIDGSAHYFIPLNIPPGRAEIQPELSLQYSNWQANGILGVGWDLSGLSMITRSRRTVLDDGDARGIRYIDGKDGDRYSLDGQRLVLIGGNFGRDSIYGAHGTEYTTQKDINAKIVSYEPDILGPSYFKVFMKDGRVLTYESVVEGWRVRSTLERTVTGYQPSGAPIFEETFITDYNQRVRFGWALSKVEDRSGNFMTISYRSYISHSGTEMLPDTIKYTGHSGKTALAPSRIIRFGYEPRPDTEEVYIGGFKLKKTKRLKKLTIRWLSSDNSAAILLCGYKFKYRNDGPSRRSLLISLHEYDKSGICKSPTCFEWDWRMQSTDLIITSVKTLGYTPNSIKYMCSIMNIGDVPIISSDVQVEAYLLKDGHLTKSAIVVGGRLLAPDWPTYLKPGVLFTGTFESAVPLNVQDTPYFAVKVVAKDTEEWDTANNISSVIRIEQPFNPEFRPDLVVSDVQVLSYSTTSVIYRLTVTNFSTVPVTLGNLFLRTRLSADEIFGNMDDSPTSNTVLRNTYALTLGPGDSLTRRVLIPVHVDIETRPYLLVRVDTNGDIVEWRLNNNTKAVLLSPWDGFADIGTDEDLPSLLSCRDGRYTVVGDPDGDGRDEYVTGQFSSSRAISSGCSIDPDPAVRLVDINKDGYDDTITFERPSAIGPPGFSPEPLLRNKIIYSNGFETRRTSDDTEAWRSYNKLAYVLDLNGDGLPELLEPVKHEASAEFFWAFRLNDRGGLGKEYIPSGIVANVSGSPSSPNLFKGLSVDLEGDGQMSLVQLPKGSSIGMVGGELKESPKIIIESNKYRDPLFADVNGDGLVDWISKGETPGGLQVSLNTGNGFLRPELWNIESPYGKSPSLDGVKRADVGLRVIDYNGDGKSDLFLMAGYDAGTPFAKRLVILESTGHGFIAHPLGIPAGASSGRTGESWPQPPELIQNGGPSIDEWRNSQVLDVNGDGLSDFVQVVNGKYHEYIRMGWPTEMLRRIVDGFGASDVFDYRPISCGDTYSADHDCLYPLACVKGKVWVVRCRLLDCGDEGFRSLEYCYRNGAKDLAGRGWLGFAEREVTNSVNNAKTTVVTDNLARVGTFYPFAFISKAVIDEIPINNKRIFRRQRLSDFECVMKDAEKLYSVYPKRIDTTEWEGLENSRLPIIRKNTETRIEDFYGNPTCIEEIVYAVVEGDVRGRAHILRSKATYDNFEASWIIGQKTNETIESITRSGRSSIRDVEYEYYPETGLLWKTRVEPQYARENALEEGNAYLETIVERNVFGLATSIRREGSECVRVDTFGYDETEHQFITSAKNPAGHLKRFAYHQGFGLIAAEKDENGKDWVYHYDGFGRLRFVVAPDGADTELHYEVDSAGRLAIRGIRPGRSSMDVHFDRLGREVRRQWKGFDGRWIEAEKGYDILGRIRYTTIPCFEGDVQSTRTYEYDNLNRLTCVMHPDGNSRRYEYYGLKTVLWDENSNESYIVEDELGRVAMSCDIEVISTPLPSFSPSIRRRELRTCYKYGPFGLLEDVIDPNGRIVTSSKYDVLGRKTMTKDSNSGVQRARYNAFGELIKATYASGDEITYVRDILGRIKTIKDRDGTTVFNWDSAPHGVGKLADSVSSDDVRIRYTYDEISRVQAKILSTKGEEFSIEYSYDSFGRPFKITYPTVAGYRRLSIQCNYNPDGYLQSVSDSELGSVYWKANNADAMGRVTNENLGDALTTAREYDVRNRLHWLKTYRAGSTLPLQDLEYHYKANSNLKARYDKTTNPVTKEEFSYDSLNRLTGWSVFQPAAGLEVVYGYDNVGNISTRTCVVNVDSVETSKHYRYIYGERDAGPHALTSVNSEDATVQYIYDADGNQTRGPDREIRYTPFSLPSRIKRSSGETIFAYDAMHRRVSKEGPGKDVTLYIGEVYERHTLSDSTIHILNIPGSERIVCQIIWKEKSGVFEPDTTLFLHNDHLGSIVAVTDGQGNMQRFGYEPFGERRRHNNLSATIDSSSLKVHKGFTGHEYDDNLNLINMKGRIYDPSIGRFLTPDPVVEDSRRGQFYNAYSYAHNNPLKYTDPSGLQSSDSSFPIPGLDCVDPGPSTPTASSEDDTDSSNEDNDPNDASSGSGPSSPDRTSADDVGKQESASPHGSGRGLDKPEEPVSKYALGVALNRGAASPKKASVTVNEDMGHGMLFVEEAGVKRTILSFGPAEKITQRNAYRLPAGTMEGTTSWPIHSDDDYFLALWPLTEEQYNKLLEKINELESDPGPYTQNRNCTSVLNEVTESIGIELPPGIGLVRGSIPPFVPMPAAMINDLQNKGVRLEKVKGELLY